MGNAEESRHMWPCQNGTGNSLRLIARMVPAFLQRLHHILGTCIVSCPKIRQRLPAPFVLQTYTPTLLGVIPTHPIGVFCPRPLYIARESFPPSVSISTQSLPPRKIRFLTQTQQYFDLAPKHHAPDNYSTCLRTRER